MFTGLVQRRGSLLGLARSGGGAVARVACAPWDDDSLEPGESVAVQGCCLTVAAVRADGFDADVLDETLRATALGGLRAGAAVNLERALRASDRLGGHLVLGHVDATAALESVERAGRDWRLRLRCGDAAAARYVVYKGSVALDGVSLTVSAVPAPGLFEVNVIPTTWRETSLSERRPGDRVNLETDILARYVEALLAPAAGAKPVTMELLRAAGFASNAER